LCTETPLWREFSNQRNREKQTGNAFSDSLLLSRFQNLEGLRRKMEAQCKDGARDDGVASLIVAAGERQGLLGVGFENMMRSWVMK